MRRLITLALFLATAALAALAPAADSVIAAPARTGTTVSPPGPTDPAFTGIVWGLDAIAPDPASGLAWTMNPDPSAYSVEFSTDGNLAVRIACNNGGGSWRADGAALTIGDIAVTLMGCPEESPLSATFGQLLPTATAWSIGDDGRFFIQTSTGESLVFSPLLTGLSWQWLVYSDATGQTYAPLDPATYTITMNPDASLAIAADCNTAFGSWTKSADLIDLTIGGMSRVACGDGSLDSLFLDLVDRATGWSILGGYLYLYLADGTVMTFTRGA